MQTTNPTNPLRRERLRRGLSQVALAARAGCSVNTVSLAERGGFLTEHMAQRFAAVLSVSPDVLRPPKPTSAAGLDSGEG